MNIGVGTGINFRSSGKNYWSNLSTAVVEDAAPDDIVLTFSVALVDIIAADFTVPGFTIASVTDPTELQITITLTEDVVYGDLVRVAIKGRSKLVTNNVASVIPDGALINDDGSGLDDGFGNFLAFE